MKAHERKNRWYKVVTCLACVVVFCTTYALILPAITLENNPCGIQEHTHIESCYTQVTSVTQKVPDCSQDLHSHTSACYDGGGNIICGYADFVIHQHDASCYDKNGTLWCLLPEVQIHTHSGSCYQIPAVPETHVHSDDCYSMERGELLCTESTEPAHTHTDACYTEEIIQVCTLPESAGHTHGEDCYDENSTPICGLEESQGHSHSDSCSSITREQTCGLSEAPDHQHTDDCYAWDKVLTCTLSTDPVETEISEPVLVCGKAEVILHKHTADCFDDAGNLICGKTQVLEHQHTDACFETVEEPVDTEVLTCTLSEDENHTHGPLCYGTWELTCGMEEHTHTPACFSDSTADVETAQEWEQTFADVRLTGEWPVDVIAIAKTQLGYTESTRNYTVWEDGSQHGYTRYGDWYGSPYGDWCAMFVSFCIHYADVEGMPLNWGCRTWIADLEQLGLYCPADSDHSPKVGDLVFYDWEQDGLSDHVGLAAELLPASGEESAKLIAIEGNSSNQVRYVTYDLDDPVILGYGKLPEQTFYCGKAGHAHNPACGSACPLEEHIHTDSCRIPVEEETLTELSYEGPDYTVTVKYGADAALPEGVTLEVSEIPGDSEEYQDYLSQAAAAMEKAGQSDTVVFARFFDIRFLLEGETLEPAAPVSVTITYTKPVDTAEDSNCQAIHFAEAGTEILDVTTEQKEDGSTSFTHTQNGFSVVGDVVTASVPINSADVGPNRLPVDYYVCIDGVWTCVGSTKTGWYNNWNGTEGWTNYNRDYITVEQAVSILEPYGFTGTEENPSLVTAYQQKSDNTNVYCDTDTVICQEGDASGKKIMPLSRNGDHAGYNLYYLPKNTTQINGVPSPEGLDKSANGFYTVKVFNAQGESVTSAVVLTGDSFTYDASATEVDSWLVARVGTSVETITGSTIQIANITTPVTVSPNPGGDVGSHSVTFKVMVDGQWKTVGSLPYYYTGDFSGTSRAYITSSMAAQFFGKYGYTATTEPGYQFGYSYDDIYKIFYAGNTGYCMDVSGNTIVDGTSVQLWTSNSSTAQIFRIWDSGEGYCYITPVENSTYHVNVLGGGTADGTKLGIHTATDAASHWKVVSNGDGTTSFYNKNAPDTAVIDLPNGDVTKGNQLQIMSNGANRYWKLVQQYRISNNTASSQNTDGTWNIGLTTESNGDIVCYYLPSESGSAYSNVAESAISTNNSCWSVSVRDDTHAVYSDGELSGMVQIVKPGAEATVTVRNAEGILWSCQGMNGEPVEVESSQSEGYTTFVIQNITQPIEVIATEDNPTYRVQYYAWMDMAADSGYKPLDIIDTTGGKLPRNYSSWVKSTAQPAPSPAAVKQIYLNENGTLATVKQLMEVYAAQEYEYLLTPDLTYVNKLSENSNYTLTAIWVLKPDCDPDSTAEKDWLVYEPTASFVNRAPENSDEIMVTTDTVIRLVYEVTNGNYTNAANFYDYDITDGSRVEEYDSSNSMNYVMTKTTQYGINSAGNYSGSGAKLAFGNRNTGMSLQDQLFGSNYLNHLNASLKNPDPGYGVNMEEMRGFNGCTFGLVTSLNSDGTIRYAGGVDAPKLFNESGTVTGKTAFDNGQFSLEFNRTGDTYTLSAVNGTNAVNLDHFNHALGSNNFWPMDAASTWGADGHDLKFGSSNYEHARRYNTGYYYSLPVSDDGQDHNSYFGMQYAVNFNLTEDYVGPLEYYFYGDDDMWVFLDSTLVCDIGGVHSTVGEYVNLWDYIDKGDSGSHTLSFFYTERGASGSTCYMRFTLPSVSNATLSKYHGDLAISKDVDGEGFGDEIYRFQIDLLTKEGGNAIRQTCRYMITNGKDKATYGTIKSGETIALKAGETATISGIPAGTFYRVTELTTDGYKTTVNGSEGYIIAGEIANGKIQNASFVNTPYFELPSTGGTGTTPYTIGGFLLIACAVFLLLYNHNRRRKEDALSS
ncbi:MAG: fibro-slime domain-containing protein [Faecousia sp.]